MKTEQTKIRLLRFMLAFALNVISQSSHVTSLRYIRPGLRPTCGLRSVRHCRKRQWLK